VRLLGEPLFSSSILDLGRLLAGDRETAIVSELVRGLRYVGERNRRSHSTGSLP